jgi:hypothetical protein
MEAQAAGLDYVPYSSVTKKAGEVVRSLLSVSCVAHCGDCEDATGGLVTALLTGRVGVHRCESGGLRPSGMSRFHNPRCELLLGSQRIAAFHGVEMSNRSFCCTSAATWNVFDSSVVN